MTISRPRSSPTPGGAILLSLGLILTASPNRKARGASPVGASPTVEGQFRDPSQDRHKFMAAVGGAVGFMNLELFGPGLSVRAGVDLALFRWASTRHRLLVTGEGTRFSRWGVEADFLFRGVQADVLAARADWRVYPFRSLGLHASAGTGLLVTRDRVSLELPERLVTSSDTRAGIPFELDLGWTIADRFDISGRYTHGVYLSGKPRAFGFVGIALGVRL